MKEQIGMFRAKDRNGNVYILRILQEYVPAGSVEDPNAVIPGLKSLKTADGSHVNRLDRGRYEIVATGVQLWSDDNNAP